MNDNSYTTLYTEIEQSLADKLADIRLLVCDVDGVFSDGRIYLGNNGEELKAFHTRDGYGIKALVNNGIDVAVITGRQSHIVENRMRSLQVEHIIQGAENKHQALTTLLEQKEIGAEQVAVIGDDMPDFAMYPLAAVQIAVADAHPLVKQAANWITTLPGGFGAVREVADTLLQVQNKLGGVQGMSV